MVPGDYQTICGIASFLGCPFSKGAFQSVCRDETAERVANLRADHCKRKLKRCLTSCVGPALNYASHAQVGGDADGVA